MTGTMNIIVVAVLLGVVGADHWAVSDGPKTCIVMEGNITGTIKYPKTDNTTGEYHFNVSSKDESGSCNESHMNLTTQRITIKFFPNDIKPPMTEAQKFWKLTLWFTSNKVKTFALSDFELYAFFFNVTGLFNSTVDEEMYTKDQHAETEVGAEEKNAFKCSDSALSFVGGSIVNMKNLKVIAFADLNGTVFPAEQTFAQCSLDARTSDIVPIIVGACLAILVIAVLIAYLIGRARAKRQGYASV